MRGIVPQPAAASHRQTGDGGFDARLRSPWVDCADGSPLPLSFLSHLDPDPTGDRFVAEVRVEHGASDLTVLLQALREVGVPPLEIIPSPNVLEEMFVQALEASHGPA